jgi:uncharacterized protein
MRVAEIRIYPVKGLRGHSVREAVVEPWGLVDDRRFMVVDEAGRFLSQRQLPRMAVIGADLVEGGVELSASDAGRLRVAVPDASEPAVAVSIWKDDHVAARDAGEEAAAWLSEVLGRPGRLVYMTDPRTARPVDPDFAAATDRVSFADGFPLLVTNTASLMDLNSRLASPVSMDRFRTNVAVGGAEPWAEDHWTDLGIGGVSFAGVKDCARCVVTTVDQDTGEKSSEAEPLRTLAKFRRKEGGRIIFGQNLIPRGIGRIAVGDDVIVRS